MNLKQTGYCYSVLIYALTAITLAPVGRCVPPARSHKPDLHPPGIHHDGRGLLATGGPEQRPPLGKKPENRDGTRTGDARRRPEGGHRNRDGQVPTPNLQLGDCNTGKVSPVIRGKFTVTGQLEANVANVGYQADSTPAGHREARGQRVSGSQESWRKLQPVVECGDEAMTLTVRRRRAVQLQLHQVNESSVPLSQLPLQCGYSVQTSSRDLSLMAQYDACHVTQKDDSYVLPLLWRGTPVKMSCPTSWFQPSALGPSSLCCAPDGMTIRVQGLTAPEELKVKVRGQWTPLVVLVDQCDYTLNREDKDIVIAAPFVTCGITVKGGRYTLSLQIKEQAFTLSCPVPPPNHLPPTHPPPVSSPKPEPLAPLPWGPPFYLAPPHFPHPTLHFNPNPERSRAYNPTPSPSTSHSTFGPMPLPPDEYKDYHSHEIPVRDSYKHFSSRSSLPDEQKDIKRPHPERYQKQETPSEKHSAALPMSEDAGFLTQEEKPPLHAFSQYYHYYHHPKIPLPGPPGDPDPGPEVPQQVSNPYNPDILVFPPTAEQSKSHSRANSNPFPHPYTRPRPIFIQETTAPYTPPPLPKPYPSHYPYYFHHMVTEAGKKIDIATKTNPKSSPFDHSLPRPTETQDEFKKNSDEVIHFKKGSLEWITHPRNVTTEPHYPPVPHPHPPGSITFTDPPSGTPSVPSSSPFHDPPLHPYIYYPYYPYYQMYQPPESSFASDNHVFPTPSKAPLQASSSLPHPPSYRKAATPPTKPQYDPDADPLHPYYYYYYQLFTRPTVSVDNKELLPAGNVDSDFIGMSWPLHVNEDGYHSLVYPYMAQQNPYNWHPDGKEAKEQLDSEMKDQPNANTNAHSASPCGLGPVSDSDRGFSFGCCSYPVNNCTLGQHLVFAMPDSVLEPTVAPNALPSEVSDDSCTPQRLTSDPQLYVVPLDGCGVNKHVFGETVVHQLEVHGIQSPQQDSGSMHETAPLRLLVECSSSPGSPDELRLHVMDQPPPPPAGTTPATATVQLRIATDETFTSFHPDAPLPFSLLRGRPLHVELSLLDPPAPDLVLLVHSCLAYTLAPYTSWMLIYDSCTSGAESPPLPSSHADPRHTQRITITSFLPLPTESPSYKAKGAHSHLEDPEIYFMCLTEVCSAADTDCSKGCNYSPYIEA